MTDDYLWDRSGPPDPEIQALEQLLAPLAHDGRGFVRSERRLSPRWGYLVALAGWRDLAGLRPHGQDELTLRIAGRDRSLRSGSWFVATEKERELELGEVGWMTLAVGSRLQIRRLQEEEASFYLARGSIEARVSADAQPRFFQVGTPATTCVDLGCKYTLTVDDAGDAFVEVQTGRVAFENDGRVVFVPAGATCRATRHRGHGTPRFKDAPEPLAKSLDAFDAAARELPARRRELAREVLRCCGSVRDALSAWHFLQDRDAQVAISAHVRLMEIAGRPEGLPRPLTRPTREDCDGWKEKLEGEWW